ncbi:MAG TPA: phosphate/phosphite/phosphonate ABC transporter substrate-binding protein [Candidatus Nesterenkonia stercoripullorum]|uniref:Phosphate/phosphite/phosphonate ABC transporter substrate-binding protein n=1 Tax=Candidatus Nesterenkonia stercoripullorum TaxID=2838701 RepID=A0A9D1S024_9MICC|nr:phosphate/phosphite/phosphonate ABC transporter substrate-binding protein [Candidatus Nesterenkonia stercoripullorum]
MTSTVIISVTGEHLALHQEEYPGRLDRARVLGSHHEGMELHMHRNTRSAFVVGGALALALTSCVSEDNGDSEEDSPDGDALVLGFIPSQDDDQLVEDASEISEQLSEHLDRDVDDYITDGFAGMVTALQTGQVDVAMGLGPVVFTQAIDQADAQPILQSERFGSDTYVTQWFTNDPDTYCLDEPVEAPSPQDDIDMLYCNGVVDEDGNFAEEGPVGEDALELIEEGETISFVDEGSASGYFYPATQLRELNGFDPFNDIDAQFAGGHPQSVQNVYEGEIAVGVSFDDARESLYEEFDDIGEEVVVFAWSENIPNDGIAVGEHVDEDETEEIKTAFEDMAASEEGEAALNDIYDITGLVDVDLDALETAREVADDFGDEAQ